MNCVGIEGSGESEYQDPTLLNGGKGLEEDDDNDRRGEKVNKIVIKLDKNKLKEDKKE